MMSYSVFYTAEMSTMSTCADQFQISLVIIHAQHTHTHTHARMHAHTRTQSHIPRCLSLLPGCDPETAVCLHTSKGEWLSIGMTSTQEIIGTSETPPTAPSPLHFIHCTSLSPLLAGKASLVVFVLMQAFFCTDL